jgi:hypothetical protein
MQVSRKCRGRPELAGCSLCNNWPVNSTRSNDLLLVAKPSKYEDTGRRGHPHIKGHSLLCWLMNHSGI